MKNQISAFLVSALFVIGHVFWGVKHWVEDQKELRDTALESDQ